MTPDTVYVIGSGPAFAVWPTEENPRRYAVHRAVSFRDWFKQGERVGEPFKHESEAQAEARRLALDGGDA